MSDLKKYEQSVKLLYNISSFEKIKEGKDDQNIDITNVMRTDILESFKSSANEYGSDFTAQLEGLNTNKIAPFTWVLDMLGVSSKNNAEESDVLFFENAIASLAILGVWKNIWHDYNKLEVEDFKKLLENKELETKDFIVLNYDKYSALFQKLKQLGFNIEQKEKADNVEGYSNVLSLYNALKSDVIVTEPKKDKQGYIYEMIQRDFLVVEDNVEIMENTKIYSNLIDWLTSCYCEKAPSGYKSAIIKLNENTLKKEGILDTKELNIWDANLKSNDEDLKFRVFVRESDFSLEVVIKLPLNTGTDMFGFADIVNNNNAAQFFNNADYNCSLLERPKIMSMKSIYKINTTYDSVNFVVVKDLLEFKDASWKLIDYLKAATGVEKNTFSKFSSLPLGEEIVVGVKPNGLKSDIFDYTGKYFNSGLIIGGAGSGKSALIHSLVVQFLALKGAAGNGSVMLFDAKQELPNAWRDVFKSLNLPFYGFDSRIIQDPRSAKFMNSKGQITSFSTPLPQVICGLYFVSALQEVINTVLGKSGMEHIKDYNMKQNKLFDISALPRIAVIMDEWNILFDTIIAPSKTARNEDPNFMFDMYKNLTGYPKKTRTQGLMWWYSGQDISKSYIGANQLSSITYRIVGTMPTDRYEYYNIVENDTVKEYEKKNFTGAGQRPIMAQGSFYAGGAGQTEFVRSLFLTDNERLECLKLLNSEFAGMFELDNLVKCALKNELFDNYCTNIMGVKNNLIFVALHDIGIISDEEFYEATNRIFNKKAIVSNSGLDYEKMAQAQAERKKQLENLNSKPELSPEELQRQSDIENKIKETEAFVSENKELDEFVAKYLKKYESILREYMQKPLDTVTDIKKISAKPGKQLEFDSEKEKKLRLFDGAFANREVDYLKRIRQLLQEEDLESEKILLLIEKFKENYTLNLQSIKQNLESIQYAGDISEPTDIPDAEDTPLDTSALPISGDESKITPTNDKPVVESDVNKRNLNSNTVKSQIDTKDLKFNVNNTDELGNVKAANQLTQQVIKDIKQQFGGINNINSIAITANECLVIDEYTYIPTFSDTFMDSLGIAIKKSVENGQIGKIVNMGKVIHSIMPNIMELTIESPKVAYNDLFQNELGVLKGYDKLFKKYSNLEVINLPDNELTRDNPKGKPVASGLGLGSKLSNLFGFGRSKDNKGNKKSLPSPAATFNNNGLVDKFFESRPVRILTGAFGWTMGCKAVVFAATVFGPWGLLFGALAMAGTYNELKGDKHNTGKSTGRDNGGQRQDMQRTNNSRPRNKNDNDS